jgi:hypothetical protein
MADRLVGGQGTLATPKPIRTVGSYRLCARALFDYIRRAMPQDAPQSRSDVYAVSGYILNLTGGFRPTRCSTPGRFPRSRCRIEACLWTIRGPTLEIRRARWTVEKLTGARHTTLEIRKIRKHDSVLWKKRRTAPACLRGAGMRRREAVRGNHEPRQRETAAGLPS